MFTVKETSIAREQRITNLVQTDPALAVILAAVHVEWTLRRAIIALGTAPNTVVRAKLSRCHGLQAYKELWRQEVTPRTHVRLNHIVSNWDGLVRAFKLRHRLVHGAATCQQFYAEQRVSWALEAARNVRAFVADRGVDVDRRLPIRRQALTA